MYDDVHRTAGMTCTACHDSVAFHGDGEEYTSLLDPDHPHSACEDCHVDGDAIVGTARLRIVNGDGKAERVAVKAVGRRGGVGRALMRAMEAEASRLGAQRMRLNAQVSAIPFYEALGYTAHGPEFGDAGIPHRAMRRDLAATQGG